MISKRIADRKDGKTSALDSLRYGAGLKIDRKTGKYQNKSHRTRLGGFGLVENGVYQDQDTALMLEIIDLAALEMQTNCDLNNKVGQENKIAHFIFSYDQEKPSEGVLRDTEDSTLVALRLDKNHYASFLHDDNGHWHLHLFVSRINKDELRRGNSLWRDRMIRDHVCREIEIRHGLTRDNGLHEIDASASIVEIPIAERRAKREVEKAGAGVSVSDGARKFETNAGEKPFQSWCSEVRIGDRLKYSNSWRELHEAASAYSCEIKPRGAGFVICPIGQKGGIQLSKIGLKNLLAKFGEFEPVNLGAAKKQDKPVQAYRPEPSKSAKFLFERWRSSYSNHKEAKVSALYEFRKSNSTKRLEIRELQKTELAVIQSTLTGSERMPAISIAKMRHASALVAFTEITRNARSAIYKSLEESSPGATFTDYLLNQAQAGDEAALALIRQYGVDAATSVSRQSEATRFNIVASLSGFSDKSVPRLQIKHLVECNGTVVFDLGEGRIVIDSASAKQIQLNFIAANDPVAIETSLRFAVSRFGNPLTLTGAEEFQRLAVETAVRNGLFIKFADPALEQYHAELSASIFNSPTLKEKQHVEHTKQYSDQRNPASHGRDRLHCLPELNLDTEPARHQMLLQSDVPSGLEQLGGAVIQRRRSFVRQPGLAGRIADKASIRLKPHSYTRVIQVIVAQQEKKMDEPQEINRSDITHFKPVASTTKEGKKPLSGNLLTGLAVVNKISKVER